MNNRFYSAFDAERMIPAKDDDVRSCFQIDRDRVLHTPTFRKLQSKTQVFWSGEYDFYRTRLTHSLEVAQIGRSICGFLNDSSELLGADYFIDGDLVEAVCLSHDLGHPPFGHAGEKTLNELMREDGGFEGNAQTLRLLTERIFSVSKTGMHPTRAFMDGVLKYKSLWSEMKDVEGMPPRNHFIYDEQSGILDWVFGGRDFPLELGPGRTRDGFKSVECQVMDWADDTAYSLNDLADSVRAGFLRIERIECWADEAGVDRGEGTPVGDLLGAIRRGKVEPMLGSRIGKYVRSVSLREDVNFMSGVTNRYRYVMEVARDVREESEIFKRLAYEMVFRSPELNQLEFKGDFMLQRLWGALEGEYVGQGRGYRLLPDEVADEIAEAENAHGERRLLCDFLASLSDTEATRMYQRLFVPGVGSIGDLVG